MILQPPVLRRSIAGADHENPKDWLNTFWPDLLICNKNYTMQVNNFPFYVRNFIYNNWKKTSDQFGGIYEKTDGLIY